jgi:putative ABC transport system permease protein
MGMHIARGRGLTPQDVATSEPVMLVNETFAKRYIKGDPLDARLPVTLDETREGVNPWRIVGIVADTRHRGATEPTQPEVYAAIAQITWAPSPTQYLTARTVGDPAALAADLRAIIRNASPKGNGVLEQLMTMEMRLMRSLSKPRLYAVLLGAFAVFAALIAGIGLFGGLSYGVTQRTREIGVRTALGATPRDIVSLIVKQGAIMTAAGLAIGLGSAAATVQYLAGFLFGVEPLDPVSFLTVGLGLLLVAMLACAIPARRAARIDAITALRA